MSRDTTAPPRSPLARVLLAVIAAYRWTASLRSPRCRFLPTCSSFAAEAVGTYGAFRGGWLAVRRIARCHPWNPGGLDPVPPLSRHPLLDQPSSVPPGSSHL